MRRFLLYTLLLVIAASCSSASAQAPDAPLTNDEFVRLLRQIPSRPDLKAELVNEVRRRGINFPLTSGLRSLIATKSGNDADLRRTLEEAERRRLNPTAAALPPEAEAREVLARAREATLAAADQMPDFVVRQQIIRSLARGETKNWNVQDRLTVAVSFRPSDGERYRVLAVNGIPVPEAEAKEGASYSDSSGASSTGEYVSRLVGLFREESRTDFRTLDTDTLRGRRAVVYEYAIKKENSRSVVSYGTGAAEQAVIVGTRGRIWIDRETFRVLRLEAISTDLPADFPVSATTNVIDYDWVTIADRQYLLPVRAVVEMTGRQRSEMFQTRNDVRFRNYQKYGSEVRVIEEDIEDEEPQQQPEKKP
ncbi:MAG TPA: hypothetical protein VGV59_19965 [Pyrinomonadaceae bacterium]|nr:hypothetical protein [Pyrinomonadaceae bacterium]